MYYKKNCASSWSLTRSCIEMHGQQNIKKVHFCIIFRRAVAPSCYCQPSNHCSVFKYNAEFYFVSPSINNEMYALYKAVVFKILTSVEPL